ncbi:LysR substrate-binding domain-containing protein [Acidiphilium acidophilum]|uniref:LysR substrate-binding domain-containing protein n=1 Tax=Acidiphilium acidophilum TaxID=76588 RepID=UPI002E8E7035|nr:LysR substrate-binding domain-containing protein [Acidiphilium acidophilum]
MGEDAERDQQYSSDRDDHCRGRSYPRPLLHAGHPQRVGICKRSAIHDSELAGLLERSNGGRPRMFASASMATLLRMALDGIGIAAIPPAIVRDDIADGRLVRLRSGHRLGDLGFVAAWAETSEKFLISGIADLAAESAL